MNYLYGCVLGIETSCDETSAAVFDGGKVLSNVVSSQSNLHARWGGVVPEMAARAHTENIIHIVNAALEDAGINVWDLKGIAVTNRPGLIGALSVGLSFAKGLAYRLQIPLVGIDHLEAHLLAAGIEDEIQFPHLSLLVSGGHTEMILIREPGAYERVGGTIDDAAGEAFDKVARTLGLGYPGGPAIEKAAEAGDPKRFFLPRGLPDPNVNFSFSGLKTAVKLLVEQKGDHALIPDVAASFQEVVTSVLSDRLAGAARECGARQMSLSGGVAANRLLREKTKGRADEMKIELVVPAMEFCTDNAAMIAHVGSWRLSLGCQDDWTLEAFAKSPI